jgi:hypothetical protein
MEDEWEFELFILSEAWREEEPDRSMIPSRDLHEESSDEWEPQVRRLLLEDRIVVEDEEKAGGGGTVEGGARNLGPQALSHKKPIPRTKPHPIVQTNGLDVLARIVGPGDALLEERGGIGEGLKGVGGGWRGCGARTRRTRPLPPRPHFLVEDVEERVELIILRLLDLGPTRVWCG